MFFIAFAVFYASPLASGYSGHNRSRPGAVEAEEKREKEEIRK